MASAKIQATEPVGGTADRPPLGLLLDPDPARGRELARQRVLLHLTLTNYLAT
jgi:hypothetical protein